MRVPHLGRVGQVEDVLVAAFILCKSPCPTEQRCCTPEVLNKTQQSQENSFCTSKQHNTDWVSTSAQLAECSLARSSRCFTHWASFVCGL